MAGKLKEVVLKDVHALIKHLSGFEEEEANFKSCERFILSHILHHRFLSVNSHAIRRSLQGIVLKFNVNGLFNKARIFDAQVQNFLRVFDCIDTGTVDVQWAILSLLLHLADNPTHTALNESLDEALPVDVLEDDVLDWNKFLREGDEEYFHDWHEASDLDEEIDNVSLNAEQAIVPTPPSSFIVTPVTSYSTRDSKHSTNVLQQVIASEKWLKDHLQHTWWTKAVTHHLPLSVHPASRSAMLLDKAENTSVENSTLSEHKVVLEILWLLSAPCVSTLFMKIISDDGTMTNFCVRPHVTIPSLWQNIFVSLLNSVSKFADMIKTFKDFSYKLYHCDLQENIPSTYQAYDVALQNELAPLYALIADLEQRVHKQNETFTILSILEQLHSWLSKLACLHNIHQCAVLDWEKQPNWLCATHLLSVLLSHLRTAGESTTVFRIFIKTFKVYVDIVGQWHSEGQLLDWQQEFLVSRCENGSDLFGAVFEKRDWEQKITSLGIECPKVLCLLADYVLKAAQPLHVLHQLNRLPELQLRNSSRSSLYSWFLKRVISSLRANQPFTSEHSSDQNVIKTPWWNHVDRYLPKKDEPLKKSGKIDDFVPRSTSIGIDFILNHLSRWEDQLLQENFLCLLDVPASNDSSSSFNELESSNDEHLILDELMNLTNNLSEISPLEWCLEKAVQDLPAFWEGIAGSMVADILMSEQQLLLHLQNAQSVFMVQAGHKLQPFISHLFKLMMQRSDLAWADSYSLSVLLQDCMDSDYFTVSVVTDNKSLHTISVLDCIDCFSVNYQVEWPLCAILGGNSETAYNAIFRLLLKLRWGLWNLEHIAVRGISNSYSPLSQRLMLLRFQLLNVIRSSYNFLCGHILNALGMKFYEKIQNANDLHKIVKAHDKFLFDALHKSLQADVPDPVKNALFQLVVLAENIHLLCAKDQHSVNPSKLSNMEACYADCHLFLALALRTLVQEEGLQHLAFLSDLVNWNIPNHKDCQ